MNNIFNIIQNTPINPLSYNTSSVSLNQMAKLDKSYPVILVDTSYWLYYRFFALRNWYNRAYPDLAKQPNFNMEHNWLTDEIFITKYQKLFIDNIKTICKKNKTVLTNVVFCIDCSHKDIWRIENNKDYKGTRLQSHIKNEFNSYELFSYIKKNYIPQLQVLYGIKTFYNNKCEADDIIGHFAPFLITNNFPKVFILANDNDYLQICSNNIIMINGSKDAISAPLEYGEQYLIKKILIGDNSDNIKCCSIDSGFIETGICSGQLKNIYKHLANKLINTSINTPNKDDNTGADGTDSTDTGDKIPKYEYFKDILDKIRKGEIKSEDSQQLSHIKNFYNNTKLMDFQMIPKHLKQELITKFINFI